MSGIAGTGFGFFQGSYTHEAGSNGAHPWYSFNLVAGQQVNIALTTTFTDGSYLWLYDVLDNNVMIGDRPGFELDLVAESDNTDTPPGPFLDQNISYIAANSGQYVVQVDSWVGGSGDYELTITASPLVTVPEPASFAMVALGLVGLGAVRRRTTR